jgi:hypothetical protein
MVAGINKLYMRALAKVGFHYFLWTCPVLRGDEDTFAALRSFISDGQADWKGFVQIDAGQFLPVLREGYVPNRTSHFFGAALHPKEAIAYVQFFVGPNAPPPSSRIRLGDNPTSEKGLGCHQASYFDDDADRGDGHDGELLTIQRWDQPTIDPAA